MLAYLRVVANPLDEVSLTRIVNVPPRGIGDTTVKQMQAYAVANGMTLSAAARSVGVPRSTLVDSLRRAESVDAKVRENQTAVHACA